MPELRITAKIAVVENRTAAVRKSVNQEKLKRQLSKHFKVSAVIVVILALATFCCALGVQQEKPARSVWDGVYTGEQAKRGEPLYHLRCASCHGDKMTGGESAPPLVGGQFLSNWNGLTLDVLFERIRISMPSDKPAAVTRPAKADILAYILSMNNFPAGKADLPYKAELMKDVMIDADKPKAGPAKTGAQ